MTTPAFRTKREWWQWYSNVYMHCNHWLKVVRPAVWKYRKGVCCFCNRKIGKGPWNCHHGDGAYRFIGEEEKHLEMMYCSHPRCHKKAHGRLPYQRLIRIILG